MAEVQEKEARLADELVQTRTALEALQRLHQNTQNQLFSIQSRTEDEAAGMQSELEFATAEMERAQQRLGMLEREKEALLAKVHAAAAEREAEAAGGSRGAEESLRQELTAQRELSARLQVEVSGLRRQVEGETAAWSARYEGLKSTLEAREAHCAALEAELTARPTQREMDELRSQVRILHAVGYNAFDEEDAGQPGIGPDGARGGGALGEGAAGGSGGGRGSGTRARSLEAALLAKAKHLEHQLTMSKLELSDVRGEAEAATAKVADLQAELEEQKALVAKLEEDLVTADQAGGGLAAENTARTSSEALPDGASGGGGEAGGSGADGGGDQAMLLVLTAQRDRFRNRVRDLEEGVSMLTQDLQRVRNEAQAVRADNLALVERLKFVQVGLGGWVPLWGVQLLGVRERCQFAGRQGGLHPWRHALDCRAIGVVGAVKSSDCCCCAHVTFRPCAICPTPGLAAGLCLKQQPAQAVDRCGGRQHCPQVQRGV